MIESLQLTKAVRFFFDLWLAMCGIFIYSLVLKTGKKALADGPVESNEIKKLMVQYRIGDKTLNEVKNSLGIKPFRKMRVWYWALPGNDNPGRKE